MSSEGKKKRGESGKKNAESIAFRYGGSKCNYSLRHGATTHPKLAGSKLVNAMKYGMIVLPLLGFKVPSMSHRLETALDAAMSNCTSPHLV